MILHFHYGTDVVKPLVKIWPAAVFGISVFNLVAALALPRGGLVGGSPSAPEGSTGTARESGSCPVNRT